MPFVRIITNEATNIQALSDQLPAIASKVTGKPVEYIMTSVEFSPNLKFAGISSPCAIIQVESIGGDCGKVCGPLTNLVSTVLGVSEDRIFCNFTSFDRKQWAMAGETF